MKIIMILSMIVLIIIAICILYVSLKGRTRFIFIAKAIVYSILAVVTLFANIFREEWSENVNKVAMIYVLCFEAAANFVSFKEKKN